MGIKILGAKSAKMYAGGHKTNDPNEAKAADELHDWMDQLEARRALVIVTIVEIEDEKGAEP